jgi:hypothetical protein
MLRDPSHHFAGKPIVSRLSYHEHQFRRLGWPRLRRNAHDARLIYLNRQRFHFGSVTHEGMLPSFFRAAIKVVRPSYYGAPL